jgi:pteridine reductase
MPQTATPVALITGAARRVGRAVALRLAQGGFDIVFTYLSSAAEAAELALQVQQMGRRAVQIQVDLSEPAQAVAAILAGFSGEDQGQDQGQQEPARLDVLVNNASLFLPDEPGRQVELLRKMMAVHVEAPMLLCEALAPRLRHAKGRIINMVDILAERPWPAYGAYCASKAALISLTRAWARRFAPDVTTNGIAPGVVEWPEDFPEPQRQKYLGRVPLARAGSPQDVANLVHFLATEGSYINGQIIRLDGGRSLT